MTRLLSALLGALALVTAAPVVVAAEAEDAARWEQLRETLFPGRTLHDGSGVISLEAPKRAYDAAIVPISIEPGFPQSEDRYIRTVTLVIDENPMPVAGVFRLSPANGVASIATRVRVNAYTHVRAIAETSDGELYMTSRYVKASGGCSAPAGKDPDAALARMGRMKFKPQASPLPGQPREVQLLISHPNHTGMQMDQLTHLYVPAKFIRELEVRYGDEPVLAMESGISLSEDPSIRFSYVPDDRRSISVRVVDSDGEEFTEQWDVQPAGDS